MSIELTKDPFLTRISVAQCRKILKDESLTDEQVLAIRDFLYLIGEIDYRYQQEQQAAHTTIIIPLKPATNDEEESHSLRPRKYRRAG